MTRRRTHRFAWIVLGLATACTSPGPVPAAGDQDAGPVASGAVCPRHDLPLQPREVPIEYGLPIAPTRAYREAERRHFPHADVRVLGGCVPRAERTAWIESCSACRKARTAWLALHQQYPSERLPLPGGWLPG